MSFAFSYIAGREVQPSTTEDSLLDSIAEKLSNDPKVDENAKRILGRDLTEEEIQSVVEDTAAYTSNVFEGKRPVDTDKFAQNITLQGAPGSGKTSEIKALCEGWPESKRNAFVPFGYDEQGVIHSLRLWKQLMSKIEPLKGNIKPQELQILRLAARDIVRDATAVGYDLAKNRTLTGHFNAINDTTVSSPHAVSGMRQYADSRYINHGMAFHAPLAESLKRCFERERGLNIKEEAIGKRGPVMGNYAAYLDTIVNNGGSLPQYFTPDIQERYARRGAFQIVGGKLTERTDNTLKSMITSLENDLKTFANEAEKYGLSVDELATEKESLEVGTGAYIEKLESILKTKVGKPPTPTTPG